MLLYEHYIQPEGLAPLGMGWLFFLSWLTARRLIQGRPWFWPLAGLPLSNLAIYFIKPNWASPLALLDWRRESLRRPASRSWSGRLIFSP